MNDTVIIVTGIINISGTEILLGKQDYRNTPDNQGKI